MLKKVIKWVLCFIVCVVLISFAVGWAMIVYELSILPNDDVIVGYVENLIGQNMEESSCHVVKKYFNSNIREYSLYVVILIEEEFNLTKVSTDIDEEEAEQLTRLFHQACNDYGAPLSKENVVFFADKENELYYLYEQQEKVLALRYE